MVVYVRRDKPKPKFWIPLIKRPLKGLLKTLEMDAPDARMKINKGILPKGTCKSISDARNPYNFRDICPWASSVCFVRGSTPTKEAKYIYEASKTPGNKVVKNTNKSFIPRKNKYR